MVLNTSDMNLEKAFDSVLVSDHSISRIFVFTGPVGAGRHTVAEMIRTTHGIHNVVPYTTRQRRFGEVDGQDVYFIHPTEFFQAQQKEEFLEVTEISGDLYGIKYRDIEQMRLEGIICLILSRSGTEKLKEIYGENVIRIFIYADKHAHVHRLGELGRSKAEIEELLLNYEDEMGYREQCEFSFENGDLAHTAYDLARSLDRFLHRNLIEMD